MKEINMTQIEFRNVFWKKWDFFHANLRIVVESRVLVEQTLKIKATTNGEIIDET